MAVEDSWGATSGEWTEQGEWPAAVRTTRRIANWGRLSGGEVGVLLAGRGEQLLSGLLKQLPIGGTEQTVVTDFDEAWGQDVLEEAANELFGGDGGVLNSIGGGLFKGESDEAIFQFAEAVVADSDAKDVRGEVLKGLLAGADGLGVDHPRLAPNSSGHQRKQS